MYNKITPQIIDKFKRIVGADNVLSEEHLLEKYSEDETSECKYFPEAVVLPRTSDEITHVMMLANEHQFPVTPRGTGTGVTGGALPVLGGVVLSLERMNDLLEIDLDNMIVITEPGVITGDLHAAVEKEGLFYPPDPNSLEDCSIGGNVAENAGGPRAVKYGVTRDYVLGLEAVLPSGEKIKYGGKLVKDVTGYDLSGLLTGSEGTLGIITRIILSLRARPSARIDLLVPFSSIDNAVKTVSEMLRKRINLTVVEFMDRTAIKLSEKFLERELPFNNAAAHLLIEVDGDSEENVESQSERIGEFCLGNGAEDVLVADNEATRTKVWESRRKMRDAFKAMSPKKFSEDVVVPRIRIPALIEKIQKLSAEYTITNVNYGHVGDGNVHVNFLKMDMDDTTWYEVKPMIIERLFRIVVEMDGSISGEHGIGLTKKNFLNMALGKPEIDLMRKVKEVLDPNWILNPGKIFDRE